MQHKKSIREFEATDLLLIIAGLLLLLAIISLQTIMP